MFVSRWIFCHTSDTIKLMQSSQNSLRCCRPLTMRIALLKKIAKNVYVYHEDISAMNASDKYMGIKVHHVHIGTARQTRLQASADIVNIVDGIPLVKERLKTLAWRLQNDLKSEVFDQDTVEMIENIRVVCDLKTALAEIKKTGAIMYGLQNSEKFLKAVRSITSSISGITDQDVVKAYRKFVRNE